MVWALDSDSRYPSRRLDRVITLHASGTIYNPKGRAASKERLSKCSKLNRSRGRKRRLQGSKGDEEEEENVDTSSVGQSILGRISTSARLSESPNPLPYSQPFYPLLLPPSTILPFSPPPPFLSLSLPLSLLSLLFHFIPLHVVAALVTSSFFSRAVHTHVSYVYTA